MIIIIILCILRLSIFTDVSIAQLDSSAASECLMNPLPESLDLVIVGAGSHALTLVTLVWATEAGKPSWPDWAMRSQLGTSRKLIIPYLWSAEAKASG